MIPLKGPPLKKYPENDPKMVELMENDPKFPLKGAAALKRTPKITLK